MSSNSVQNSANNTDLNALNTRFTQRKLTAEELERLDPDGDIQDDPIDEDKQYIYLTNEGYAKVKEAHKYSTRNFFLFSGGGFLAGVFAASNIKFLPFAKDWTDVKIRKYRMFAFLGLLIPASYHGYKVSIRDFKRKKKVIFDNPDYCIQIGQDDMPELD